MGPRGHRRHAGAALGVVPCEWVGGRYRAPLYVTGEGPAYRPDVILWLDAGRNRLLSADVVRPHEPNAAIVATLERALGTLATNQRPERVRVPDVATAELLRAHFGVRLRVSVGETPEVEVVLEDVVKRMGGGEAQPGYLAGGATSGELARLFRAAAALYRVAPWRIVVDDTQLIAVEAPGLGIKRGCVSIIGALGEHLGLLLFQSIADFRRFCAASELNGRGERPKRLGINFFSLTFVRGSELAASARREIVRHGWEVADARGYPWLQIVEPDFVERPAGAREVALATVLAEAMGRFMDAHRALFGEPAPTPATASYTIEIRGEPQQVTVAAPHPDAPWDREPTAAEAEVRRYLREEAADGDKIVAAFLAALRAGGADERRVKSAEVVTRALYGFKVREHDGRAEGLDVVAVERFLLDYVPASIAAPPELIESMPEVVLCFVRWLAADGGLARCEADAICRRIGRVRRRFRRNAGDPARWSLPKALMMEARAAGVDITDEAALRHHLTLRKRSRVGARSGPLAMGRSSVPPGGLCPCGSGRKLGECCGQQ